MIVCNKYSNNVKLNIDVYGRTWKMFLHIGGDVVIPMKNVIAIMDIDTTTISKDTKEFLKIAEEEGLIKSISEDLPKSFIITETDKKSKIYLSPISSVTLQKRSHFISEIANV
jgi:extracellular matrix regulatory protein B